MEHNAVYELLESYVFGTLDREEVEAVETHLDEGCETCLERLREVTELSASLAGTVPQHDPPLHVKTRLMEKVRATRPEAAAKKRSSSSRGWVGWAAAAVATAAVVLLVIWTSTLQTEITKLNDEMTKASGQVTRLQQDIAAREDATILLNKPGIHFVDMAGVEPNPQAFGKVVIDPDKGTAVVYMYRLPQTPEGMEYQLWILREGEPVSAGVFRVAADGSAMLEVRAIPDPREIAAFQVTIEPAGGLSEPTGMMYLTGPNIRHSTD